MEGCILLTKRLIKKMNIQEEIYKTLGQKLLDEFDSKKLVDWAVRLLAHKYESESLFILAGLDYNSREEREHYFWRAIEELGIDLDKETSDISYGKYIAALVINNTITPEAGLNEMTNIYHATKHKKCFLHFYEIEKEIGWIENVGYPPGIKPEIPIENLEEFLKKEFELFLK